jgi:putative transcriptional regulator
MHLSPEARRIKIADRRQMQTINLTNHFLIAMPAMSDPNFSRTLTFVCEHNERGALGIVVNRPIDVTLSTLFRQVEIPLADSPLATQPVFYGGPVQLEHGFVLHRPVGQWKSTLPVGDVGLTTSRDILEAMARGGGPSEQLVALGYAGWAAGQLEDEIRQNGWLTVEADLDVIFNVPPEARYDSAMQALGISAANLSEEAGHA